MQKNDDNQRTVTTTVARLKAFEAAVNARASACTAVLLAERGFRDAEDKLRAARKADSDAIDAVTAATKALYEYEGPAS